MPTKVTVEINDLKRTRKKTTGNQGLKEKLK